MTIWIDLNADVGEGAGPGPDGADDELIALVSSVNVACGGHAGDPETMRRSVHLAMAAGAAIGAHPGYPDRAGFGRTEMVLPPEELEATIVDQVTALAAIVAAEGGRLVHVKAHGALYNVAAADPIVAGSVARAVFRVDRGLRVVGPPGSALLQTARDVGLGTIAEGFADRAYEPDGSLRSRRLPGALLLEPAVAAAQAVSIARDRRVVAVDGGAVHLPAESICLHGDTPGVLALARAVRAALEGAGFRVGQARLGA